jgi:hypothetical protein
MMTAASEVSIRRWGAPVRSEGRMTRRITVRWLPSALVLAAGLAQPTRAAEEAADTKPAEQRKPAVGKAHRIPIDMWGNYLEITGQGHPRKEAATNGWFMVRWPFNRQHGPQVLIGRIEVSGATIVTDQVQTRNVRQSTVDSFAVNAEGTAAEWSTHALNGRIRLPLAVFGDDSPVVRLYIETNDGGAAFQYFLQPTGLSFEPIDRPEKKKRRKKE